MQVPQLSNFIYSVIHKLAPHKARAEDAAASPDAVSSLAELNDLNYKDALFDAQIRSFLHAEYEEQEPPPTIFAQLEHAIRLHKQGQESKVRNPQWKVTSARAIAVTASRLVLGLRRATVGLYQTGSSAGTSRVLSGGLVTVLLMLAMGPNVMQVLRGAAGMDNLQGEMRYSRHSNEVSPLSPIEPQHMLSLSTPLTTSQLRLLLEQRTGEDFDAPYQIEEVPPLDPAELRVIVKKMEPTRKLITKGPE